MTQPTRYQQAAGMTWADLVMKWQGLTSRHACSKAHPEDRQQRLSISEHLDLLALGGGVRPAVPRAVHDARSRDGLRVLGANRRCGRFCGRRPDPGRLHEIRSYPACRP